MDSTQQPVNIWVLANHPDEGCLERLGDAARLAQTIGSRVGVALVNKEPSAGPLQRTGVGDNGANSQTEADTLQTLIEHGADLVRVSRFHSVASTASSPAHLAQKGATAETKFGDFSESSFQIPHSSGQGQSQPELRHATDALAHLSLKMLKDQPAKIIFVGGDPAAREWGSLMAAEQGWEWFSPVLMTRFRSNQLQITRLDHSSRFACAITVKLERPVIISMRDGVAEALPKSADRIGVVEEFFFDRPADMIQSTPIPVEPWIADIRDCKKLISGGKGLGSAAGFVLLRRVAEQLGAGVAASRMAVDQGWIEFDRQVGQTGKSVQPDLYIACGISGASHHLEGMSSAKHIVAINSDPDAPIMKLAHLKLSANLFDVLNGLSEKLARRIEPECEGP